MKATAGWLAKFNGWNRLTLPFLAVVFVGLAVWSFAVGDYGSAALQVGFGAFWALATIRNRRHTHPAA